MSSNNQQFTAGSMASDLDHLTRCFSALLSENRLMNANLIHPYDGQESINHWLRLFEVHAERWCMTDEMKFVHTVAHKIVQVFCIFCFSRIYRH
ncbi:hypothetical protein G6F66_013477 [Rhizopus arrhizus]|nr:hypothetical protein G6F23_014958 [Rhizopus arrhizus]KAG1271814.1 hypothetical protein G6F66_013477 [Rhizopus arrhizus]